MRETSLALALSGLSFMLAIIWGSPLLRVLRHFRIGKIIRVEEPDRHFTKMGTPTMGGVMILVPVMLLTILLNAASLIGVTVLGRSVLLPLLVLLCYAVLGALDDWEGIRGPRRGLGMRARTKFIFQLILAVGIAFGLKYVLEVPELFWPGFDEPISLGVLYVPIAAFI
ncbi:MAG TPA: phospho-N-acetylmuramoyl-pentapeptide-transferase, partial [Anaerolineaceae bacterium]|nr:phospho-N-acetylmuramoyl-pentapeptide-transferase [Anaerolineaceae bacterium]